MNKLEQINKKIRFHLDNVELCPDCNTDHLELELLETLVDLGDYVIRFDYWNYCNYCSSDDESALIAHDKFIVLSRRVSALITRHSGD